MSEHALHRYNEAATAHASAIKIAERLGRPRLTAVLFGRLGRVLQDQNEIQRAVRAYEDGFKALSRDPSFQLDDELSRIVGKVYSAADLHAPVDLYSESSARDLDDEEADLALPVNLLINIGNGYLLQAEDPPALDWYRKALKRPEIEKLPRLQGYALANMGEALRREGHLEEAELSLTKALSLLDMYAKPADGRRALALLAGIYSDRKQYERAHLLYEQALALYAQTNDARGQARAYASLGHLYHEEQKVAEAVLAYERAIELAQKIKDAEVLWHAFWGLGRCRFSLGDYDAAADYLRRSADLIETNYQKLRTDEGKVAFLDSAHDVFEQLIRAHLARAVADPAKYADAIEVVERIHARALHDLMESWESGPRPSAADLRLPECQAPKSGNPDAALSEVGEVPLESEGSRMQQAAPSIPHLPRPALSQPDIQQLAPGIASSDSTLPRSSEDSFAGKGAHGPTAAAPPPLTRLVFHVLSDRTAVFVVSPRGEVLGREIPLGRTRLIAYIADVRRALGVDKAARGVVRTAEPLDLSESGPSPYRTLLQQLYVQLIEPIASALPQDGSAIAIEPHDALWLLPFAALISRDDQWFGDQWPIVYTPSTSVLEKVRRKPRHREPAEFNALVVGNPTFETLGQGQDDPYGLRFEPLAGAEKEAEAVSSFFTEPKRTLLQNAAANLASVEALAPQFDVLHLATHGVAYPEDPLDSFVLLARSSCGDRLTARRVLTMRLTADLVTLSACQTGLGKLSGDGIIGLSRAFLGAGARSVLVSQWSVSDEGTKDLMEAFYRYYLRNGESKAVALQRAMGEIRSKPGYDHPMYWAPFVIVGAES